MTELDRGLETVALSVTGAVATVTLNRPAALNAFNRELGRDLLTAVTAVAADEEVRCVVITGAGRAFSAGADLKDLTTSEMTPNGRPDVYRILTERYHPIIRRIREMDKPVLAAINGPAVGVGLSFALACDLLLAAESAYLLLGFVNIGLVADGGCSMFLPTRIGFARANEMAMLGERIGARAALEWGLINRVHPDSRFDEEVLALAARIADGPTRSYAGTKRQLNRWLFSGLDDQLALEAEIQREMAETDDFLEGTTAFAQRRTPRFRGR